MIGVYISSAGNSWPTIPTLETMVEKSVDMRIYQLPGEHLALDIDLPVLAGKRVWIQPVEYADMVNQGIWSQDPLMREVHEKKYSTIELYDMPRQNLFPPKVIVEIKKNYHVIRQKRGERWLAPNDGKSKKRHL